MAQKRLRDYQDPLGSFEHNLMNLGVHFPGRFCGFDALVQTGQLQFTLVHTNSGVRTSDNVGNPYGPLGVLMTNQGVMVIEDAPIAGLTIETNAGNTNYRQDYVVLNHQYLEITGGAAATYSVLKGSLLSGAPPVLGQFQTIIGIIVIPPGATLISQCTYTKQICPDSGDSPDAKLNQPNVYSRINVNSIDQLELVAPTIVDGVNNLWDLTSKGNTFIINPAVNVYIDGLRVVGAGVSQQDGMEVNLVVNQFVKFRNQMNLSLIDTANGWFPIMFSSRLATSTEIINNGSTNVLQPSPGNSTQYVVGLILVRGVWIIKSIDGKNFATTNYPKYFVAEADIPLPLVITYFDETGLGLLDYTGWQMCNGQRGTQDRRGRFPVMATDQGASGSANIDPALIPGNLQLTLGVPGGQATHKLIMDELPAEGIDIPIPVEVTSQNQNGQGKLTCGNDVNEPGPGPTLHSLNLGKGVAFDKRPPYVVTIFIQKL